MACKECENIENYNCGCNESEHCNCSIKLSTVCIVYEGVKLTILDTYEGQELESIFIKVESLFKEIFDIIQSKTYKNIGDGAEVYKKINASGQVEFRTILSSSGIDILENMNDIGISINEQWLYDFIVNSDVETVTQISNTISGKRIATYINEDGIVKDIFESVTALTDNNDGTFTYTNEQGTPITYNVKSNLGNFGITNTIAGKTIATYTDINSNTVDINETITTLVNSGINTFTYTNENGVQTVYIPADASTSQKGIVQRASSAEITAGSNVNKYVTPSDLTQATSGGLDVATQTEANALVAINKIITPGRIPKASTTQEGIVRFATQAEVNAGSSTNTIVSPQTFTNVTNNVAVTSIFYKRGKVILGNAIGNPGNQFDSLSVTGEYTSCTVAQTSGPDLLITLNFTDIGTTNYQPVITIVGKSSNFDLDNDVITSCRNLASSSVQIALRELAAATQNVDLMVSLLKLD